MALPLIGEGQCLALGDCALGQQIDWRIGTDRQAEFRHHQGGRRTADIDMRVGVRAGQNQLAARDRSFDQDRRNVGVHGSIDRGFDLGRRHARREHDVDVVDLERAAIDQVGRKRVGAGHRHRGVLLQVRAEARESSPADWAAPADWRRRPPDSAVPNRGCSSRNRWSSGTRARLTR